jgi:choice-of-anchor A domain-containing protein
MSKPWMRAFGLSVMVAVAPVVAHAELTFEQALNQFNLVVLGDAKSSSHVDGRTFIGGSLTGNGDFVQHPSDTPASAYTGLTVLGNAQVGSVNGLGVYVGGNLTQGNVNSGAARVQGNVSNANLNGNAPAAIGGTVSSSNINSGRIVGAAETAALAAAGAQATAQDFATLFSQSSSFIAGLASTGSTVNIDHNLVTFNAVAINGVAVFDLSAIDDAVFAAGEFQFNLNGATTVIFNSDNTKIQTGANFRDSSALSYGKSFLWNFYNATDIVLGSQFGGSVLATNAKLTNYNNIEGSVVVKSLDQKGEIHLQPFTGDIPVTPVPEPGTYAMILAGLGLIGHVVARRRKA